ncbi:HNH endonuclease [Mycobacterium sp. DBP42]|uniref:HNH endonuclease n=1 Tax=Mycobacterium sp. DBP42 TaxID=2545267 RepID=UPI00110CB365|nr:HNH endonuclease signature motif containing protein [Mycobacterium sp. DBP42]TMS50967.1 HNH endonuclease [Mycobacterium sp. DBP42]
MVNKPCLFCGEPSPGTYCPGCRPADERERHHIRSNPTRWKNLSKRLRRLSPFCEFCGATKALAVDHILPISDYPELVYAEENCRVLCRSCNGKRGNKFTHDEAQAVLTRLVASQKRRPTTKGRERVNVAQRACDQGGYPQGHASPPGRKAQGGMKTTMVFNKGGGG